MEKSPGLLSIRWEQPQPQFLQQRPSWNAAKKNRTSWNWMYVVISTGFLVGILHLSRQLHQLMSQYEADVRPANSTLGFGAIYAVSRTNSPRRAQLERSAELTGLSFKIPAQPRWSTQDVEQVVADENSTLSRGSALAWLGHLNALNRFLNSSYETALIVEDDIDYDTHIRTEQIPATAHAIRELLAAQHQTKYYYGNPDLWDILWLGHCGDMFDKEQAAQLPAIKVFTDRTLPLLEDLLPMTRAFLRVLGVKSEQQRIAHHSVNPLCSFAYGVTRATAHRLVAEYAAQEPSRPKHRPCSAFDVRLLEACRDDGFKCVTVTPELFHHTLAPSEIAAVSSDRINDEGGNEALEATPNIRCSARSDLWWGHRHISDGSQKISARSRTISRLAQSPGSCYLDDLL